VSAVRFYTSTHDSSPIPGVPPSDHICVFAGDSGEFRLCGGAIRLWESHRRAPRSASPRRRSGLLAFHHSGAANSRFRPLPYSRFASYRRFTSEHRRVSAAFEHAIGGESAPDPTVIVLWGAREATDFYFCSVPQTG